MIKLETMEILVRELVIRAHNQGLFITTLYYNANTQEFYTSIYNNLDENEIEITQLEGWNEEDWDWEDEDTLDYEDALDIMLEAFDIEEIYNTLMAKLTMLELTRG